MSDQRTENGTEVNKVTQSVPLPDLPPMTKNQVMDLAMDMGKILLKSGAETSRVEDTMMRFCRSYGYYDLNVFKPPGQKPCLSRALAFYGSGADYGCESAFL